VKNIQVIDDARNCTYSVFAASDKDFEALFPAGTDIAFPDEITDRLGDRRGGSLLAKLWARPVDKKSAQDIHGTLFYDLDYKKKLYPDRREAGMDARAFRRSATSGVRDPGSVQAI
jgi:hypothetical protein